MNKEIYGMEPLTMTELAQETRMTLASQWEISGLRSATAMLTKALQRALPLVMDASALTRLDTASLQLLACFARTADERRLSLNWRDVPASVQQDARLAGFHDLFANQP